MYRAMEPDKAKIIDELGVVTVRLLSARPLLKREKELKDQIRSWAAQDQTPADASKAYLGKKFFVTLGPAENERTWKPGAYAALFARLKKAAFLATCKVTLKDATAAIGETALADLTVTERTGPRPLIVAERTS